MSTVEIPGIEVPDWWTKRTSRLYADRDKLIATEGDAAYQAALSKAMQSDQADMAAHQKAMAVLRSMPQDTPTAAFDAYVEAIKSAETPRVRNRLLKEAVDTAEAGVAYKKLRDTFDNSYGDPAQAKAEYAARGDQIQGTLKTVLDQLSFPNFLKDYQDAKKQAKSPDEAVRNTTLAYGLQALATDGGGVRAVQFELGLPPLAAGEALYRKVSKGHPALDVLEKNRNVPFVSRFLNSAGHAAPLKEDGFDVTHKMAQTDNFAYPTVVEENGKLVDLRGTGRDAFREAMARGDVIQFNSPEEALRFTQHYKEGVDLLKNKDQIVAFGSARDAYVDIARNLQAYATQYVQEHRGTTFDEGVKALQDLLAQAHPKIQELAKGLPEVGGGLGLPPFYVPPEPHRVAQGRLGQTAQTAVGELIRGPITGPLVRALPEGPQRNIEAVGNLMVPPIGQTTLEGKVPIVGGMIPTNYAASVAALTNALSFGAAYRASPAGAIGGAVTGAVKGAVPGAVARLAGAVTAGAVGGAEIPSTIEAAVKGHPGEALRNVAAGAALGAVGSVVKTGALGAKAGAATRALEKTTQPVRGRAEALGRVSEAHRAARAAGEYKGVPVGEPGPTMMPKATIATKAAQRSRRGAIVPIKELPKSGADLGRAMEVVKKGEYGNIVEQPKLLPPRVTSSTELPRKPTSALERLRGETGSTGRMIGQPKTLPYKEPPQPKAAKPPKVKPPKAVKGKVAPPPLVAKAAAPVAGPPPKPMETAPVMNQAVLRPPEAGAVGPGAEGFTAPVPPPAAPAKKALKPPAAKVPEPEKSPGHVAFFKATDGSTYELYKDAKGELFRAPVSSVFDVRTGYRQGRWEAPAHMADRQAQMILNPGKELPPTQEVLAARKQNEVEAATRKANEQEKAQRENEREARLLAGTKQRMKPPKSIGSAAASELLSNEPIVGMGTPENRLAQAIKEMGPLSAEQKALRGEELKKRFGRLEQIGATMPGEAGVHAKSAAMRGARPRVEFAPIRGRLTQADMDHLIAKIENTDLLTTPQKFRAQRALVNELFGTSGTKIPQDKDLEHLGMVLGDEFVKAIQHKTKTGPGAAAVALGAARTLSTLDVASFVMRQGIMALPTRPKLWGKMFKEQFRDLASEKNFQDARAHFRQMRYYPHLKRAGLSMTAMETGFSPTKLEEDYVLAHAIENWRHWHPRRTLLKAPAVPVRATGSVVRASDRAYSGAATWLRLLWSHDILDRAKAAKIPMTKDLFRSTASFVNAFTGRGGLGKLESAAGPSATAAFAPRFITSALRILNPATYVPRAPVEAAGRKILGKKLGQAFAEKVVPHITSPYHEFVRKEALRAALGFAGMVASVNLMAKGAAHIWPDKRISAPTDLKSSDSGKVAVGKARFDYTRGLAQYPRLLVRLYTGETVDSVTGKVTKLGEGYRPKTRLDLLGEFALGKAAPLPSAVADILRGKDFEGNPIKTKGEKFLRLVHMYTNMGYSDIAEVLKTNPELLPAALVASQTGIGVSAYPTETTDDMDAASRLAVEKEAADEKPTRNMKKYGKAMTAYYKAIHEGAPKQDVEAAKADADALARDVLEESK